MFDPDGTAGDLTSKGFTPGGGNPTGASASFVDGLPDTNADGTADGWRGTEIATLDFQVGETLSFTLDVDPNSIHGYTAPGLNESGSLGGLKIAAPASNHLRRRDRPVNGRVR